MKTLQAINFILFIGILLFLCGCGSFREYKWVENNTLYSSSSPSIEIQISQPLQEGTDQSMTSLADNSIGSNSTWVRKNNYLFWDKEGKQQLIIIIENLRNLSWYMKEFNFSSSPAFLSVSEEKIGKWQFDTGIYVNSMPQQSFLVKIYGNVFGDQTRVILTYMESVDSSWNKPHLALNSKQNEFLAGFSKRAGESFTIRPYSGIKSPEQRSEIVVSKQ